MNYLLIFLVGIIAGLGISISITAYFSKQKELSIVKEKIPANENPFTLH